MAISTNDLTTELLTLATGVAEINNKGYSVYDLNDLTEIIKYETLPLVGISYEGRSQAAGVINVAPTAKASSILLINFSILVALRYTTAAGVDDTKVGAVALLDDLRSTILGFKGVNHRGWAFNGESPISSELEGVIFYGQSWSVRSPMVGNFGT